MGHRFWGKGVFFLSSCLLACLSLYLSIARADDIHTQYFHSDHLGSTSLVTKQDGNLVESTAYTPFGETVIASPTAMAGGRSNLPTNHLYTNQELDRESSLYYYGARYYDPALARFTSRDPLLSSPNPLTPTFGITRPVLPTPQDEQVKTPLKP
jgi:RHS repeat-associated protein